MAENGKLEQQPAQGNVGEVADTNAGTLDAMIDGLDGGQAVEAAEQPAAAEEQVPEAAEAAEGTEDEAASDEADQDGEEEPEEEDTHKEVFSEEGYKIFKERIGKEKGKREKVAKELETVRTELAELKKSADPVMKEAVSAAGIAPEFLDADTAKTLAEASTIERRIAWYREHAKNPDGFEEANGKVWSQADLLAMAMDASTDPKNMELLAEARVARKAALSRQKEALAEGLKVLKAREDAAKALKGGKPKAAPAVKAKTSPPAPSTASSAVGSPARNKQFDRQKWDQEGRSFDDLVEHF
jgi:hypothetical protein